jgi:sugar lactone lactonase YvrE
VTRVYDLGAVAQGKSFIDDVRFDGANAYLTDAGRPAIIVLDLATGHARRVLENQPSTTALRPLVAEGRPLVDAKGNPIVVHADQLEISADGKWFYFQPCSGPMSRIDTRFLDDASLSASAVANHVEPFADTPSTGGTAIDANGTIYVSDTDKSRILQVSPGGKISILISDPRLAWVDAMWIDDSGKLWMPAAQLNRVAGLNHGKNAVRWPVTIYSIALGVKPLRH